MKNLITIALASSVLALTACGGDSSSSGNTHSSVTPASNPAPANNPSSNGNACAVSGTTVTATASGCTYSMANVNSGADVTYTCSGGRVSSSIGISAQTINLNGMTIQCAGAA